MGVNRDRGDPSAQRSWLTKVQEMYTRRGTPIDTVCTVCLDDVCADRSNISFTVCAHVFHQDCLFAAKEPSGKLLCPNCRNPLSVVTDRAKMATAAT
jgi:hypothetical protein